MSFVRVNDVFDEIKVENIRLLNELLIANNYLKCFAKMKSFIDIYSSKLKPILSETELQEFEELDKEFNQIVFKLNAKSNPNSKESAEDEDKVGAKTETNYQLLCYECGKRVKPETEFKSHPQIKHNQKTVVKEEPNADYEDDGDWAEAIPSYLGPDSGDESGVEECKMRPKPMPRRYKPRQCKCITCNETFATRLLLLKHVSQAHGQKGHIPCPVAGCPKMCDSEYRLKVHMETHATERNFRCPREGCDSAFHSERRLQKHQLYVHEAKKFKCDWPGCEFKSNRKEKLTRHLPKHSDCQSFVCEVEGCRKAFKLKGSLETHRRKHSAHKPHGCSWPGCDYRSHERFLIAQHMTVHSEERRFPCQWVGCDKKFKTKGHLTTHVKEAHEMTESQMIRCDWPGCVYKGKNPRDVKQHMHVHTDQRNHHCDWPQCGKSFKTRTCLVKHMRLHTSDKTYTCQWPGCQYRAVRSDYLRLHMKTHLK